MEEIAPFIAIAALFIFVAFYSWLIISTVLIGEDVKRLRAQKDQKLAKLMEKCK